jgi:hypothetical protein
MLAILINLENTCFDSHLHNARPKRRNYKHNDFYLRSDTGMIPYELGTQLDAFMTF